MDLDKIKQGLADKKNELANEEVTPQTATETPAATESKVEETAPVTDEPEKEAPKSEEPAKKEEPKKDELKLKKQEPTEAEENFEKEEKKVVEKSEDPKPIEAPKKKIGFGKRVIKVLLLLLLIAVGVIGADYYYGGKVSWLPGYRESIDNDLKPWLAEKFDKWFPEEEEVEPEPEVVVEKESVKVEPIEADPEVIPVVEEKPVHRNYPSRPKPKTFDFSKVKSRVKSYLSKLSAEEKSIETKRLNWLNGMTDTVIAHATKGGYSVSGGMRIKVYTASGSIKTLTATSLWGNKNEMLVRRKGYETKKKLKWSQLHLDNCIDVLEYALKNQMNVLAATSKRSMQRSIKGTVAELAFDLALVYDWYKYDPNAANSSTVKKFISLAIKNDRKFKKVCIRFFPNYMEKM